MVISVFLVSMTFVHFFSYVFLLYIFYVFGAALGFIENSICINRCSPCCCCFVIEAG